MRLSLPLLAVAALTSAQPFASTHFRATHNSYSGNLDGSKGPILQQLNAGVRFLEFDIHDNDYTSNNDYSLGHLFPGDSVDHGNGNPASNLLSDWLSVVSSWSAANPTAGPIVMMLDLKDDITDSNNVNFAQGNPAALNQKFIDAFGSRLFWGLGAQTLPDVSTLHGKVLPVMSGDGTTRSKYFQDAGYNPAVARNNKGQVVEVHDSGGGYLWYWSGKVQADGSVAWLRHGQYDTGQTPAIALNDDGWLVEVHQSETFTTLWYHVGYVDATTGEITWSSSGQYDNGVNPSITFVTSTTVREVHQSQSSSQNWQWNGSLNTGSYSVAWGGNAKTSDGQYTKTSSNGVSIALDGNGKLRYSTSSVSNANIAYQQVFFVETQSGDPNYGIFYAATWSDTSFITSSLAQGKVVRAWDFDAASDATSPLANYPATNMPYDSWYESLLVQNNALA